ncbi:MAG: TolC family protein [Candidatus Omnitrophica bacterium]|nr:TolC family protein [Candidatus Omnitrophota bacterium]
MSSKSHILFYIFIFLNLFLIVPLMADEVNEPLTLEEALSLAHQHNPHMIQAEKAIDGSQGELITARAWANPELEAEIGGFKGNEDEEGNTRLSSVEVRQPFDPIGARFFRRKIASNQVHIQNETLRSTWASVYLQVRESYSKIVLDIKKLELTEENLNAMRQFFGRVQERYQAGQVLKNDFQRAKIELLQSQQDYLEAAKNLKTEKARLNLALGRSLETEFDVEEKLLEENLQTSVEKLKSIALANRPDIKVANLELDSKKNNLFKEQSNRLPSYFLGLKRAEEVEGEEDYAVLIGVSIPLWNLNRGEVKKARAEMEAQATRNKAITSEALFEVYQAYLEAELAQKQFELSKKSLEESNELQRLANLRYSEGEIDFLNYLDQIRTARQSKANYYEGLFHLSRSISALEASINSSLRQEEFFNEKF